MSYHQVFLLIGDGLSGSQKTWIKKLEEVFVFSNLMNWVFFVSSCFVCVSVCVRWRACHRAGEAALCDALPVRGPPVSVPNSVHSGARGAVVVQVLLSRPHTGVLQPRGEHGCPGLWAGCHIPPGVLWHHPHCSGCGLCAGSLHDPGWALQRQRHRHREQ